MAHPDRDTGPELKSAEPETGVLVLAGSGTTGDDDRELPMKGKKTTDHRDWDGEVR